MPRGKTCTICASPDRPTIDGQLLAGVKQKTVAEQFPELSRFALSRHWRSCVSRPGMNGQGDELALWILRAEEIFNSATVNGDVRGQVGALGAALKSLEMRAKTKERERESASRDLPASPESWTEEEAQKMRDYLDAALMNASATPYASSWAKDAGLQLLVEAHPNLMPLLQKLAHAPALIAQVQNLMSEVVV